MAFILCGLLLALALYLAAIYGISWSASRWVDNADAQSFAAASVTFPSFKEVLERHSVEWLLGFFAFFLLLGITDFPLWQQLGLGGIFALFFGSVWYDQSGRNHDPGLPAVRRAASNFWFWLLAFADWLGFMWVLCFASALVLEVL